MNAVRPQRLPARAWLCACVSVGTMAAPASAADAPSAAVTYLERPEDGPMSKAGRRLTAGDARYGVDINSSIDLLISADKLRNALLGHEGANAASAKQAEQMQARINDLQTAVAAVKGASERLQDLLKTWTPNDPVSNRRVQESAAERLAILKPLTDARRNRMRANGLNPSGDTKLNALLAPGVPGGYDWALVTDLLNEEIALARRDLDRAASLVSYSLQIQPHLVPRTGPATPIRLSGYNESAAGAATRFEKLQFSSAEQEQAFKKYEALAVQIGETQSLGDGIVKQLQTELQVLRPQLDALVQAAQVARDKLRDRLSSLERWGIREQRKAWLATVAEDLRKTDKGMEVLKAWEALAGKPDCTVGCEPALLDELKADVAAVRAYADLRNPLAAANTAPQAMNVLLGLTKTLAQPQDSLRLFNGSVWQARQKKMSDFAKAVADLSGPLKVRVEASEGPVADVKAVNEAFSGLVATATQSANEAVDLLARVLGAGPAQAAANLEVPPGTRPVPITSGSQLNSRIDLQRIPAKREVGDSVEVRFDIFKGDKADVKVGGWKDEFTLRSYGWNSEVLASLAFTKPDSGASVWKATAAMNWILSYNKWPRGDDNGLASARLKWFSGAGFSVMPLTSGGDEGVKLGLAATFGLLNNRLLLGYGTNLQGKDDKRFLFFSIRVVDFPALSGPAGGGSTTP